MNILALQEYFWDESTKPQKLGVVDCVKFVTTAVYLGWGRDHRHMLEYTDRRSAVARLRELGGLHAACVHALGYPVPIDKLSAGDVIWFNDPASIGLLMPEYVAVKANKCIHRYQKDDKMSGWIT